MNIFNGTDTAAQRRSKATQYLRRIAACVQNHYISVHHKYLPPGAKAPVVPGDAIAGTDIDATIRQAIDQAFYWAKTTDVYLAMGAQREHGSADNRRFPSAIRRQWNIGACRSLYLDVDVDTEKDEATGEYKKDAYRTVEELDAGVEQFYAKTGIPRAALVVNSGRGGKHLYWPFDQLVHRDNWQPLAQALVNAARAAGLKFDAQVTTDSCRLLRIPGTFNFKEHNKDPNKPPLPVTLAYDTQGVFLVEDLWNTLNRWNIPMSYAEKLAEVKAQSDTQFKHLEQSSLVKPEDEDDLGAGIYDRIYKRADIERVRLQCPFINHTLNVGGAGYKEPLWFNSLGVACHTTDPNTVAHLMSKGHEAYIKNGPSETEQKIKNMLEERQKDPNLGPPHCANIRMAGAEQCRTCRHRDLGRTPLTVPGATELQEGIIPDVVDANGKYQPIPGGDYLDCNENIDRMHQRARLVNEGPDTVWYENWGPEGWIKRRDEDLQKTWGNVNIKKKIKTRLIYNWYFHHPARQPPLLAVFKPNQSHFPAAGEFNTWQGWGVEPNFDFKIIKPDGTRSPKIQLQLILNHVLDVLCSGNWGDFEYFLVWHAWLIQNLGQIPHTILVLKDEVRGSGKSLWGELMKSIIGKHAAIFTNKEHLFGKHSVFPNLCLAILDDIMVEKDHKGQDMLKGMVTSKTRIVEPKGRDHREIVNRTAVMVTTNHDTPLLAGVNERRQFVPTINPKYAQNEVYFKPLREVINNDGAGMFLGFLLTYQLGGRTPHQVRKTKALGDMQLAALSEIHRWLHDCAEAGGLLGCFVTKNSTIQTAASQMITQIVLASEREIQHGYCEEAQLNQHFITSALREAFFRHTGISRAKYSENMFGRKLAKLGYVRSKCTNNSVGGGRGDWGYFIPDATELRRDILKANGIIDYDPIKTTAGATATPTPTINSGIADNSSAGREAP